MPMIIPPQPVEQGNNNNNNNSLCSGIDLYTARRPPEPQWFITFNAVILYAFLALNALASVAWIALRHTERLRVRSPVVVTVMNITCMVNFVIVAGKRAWVDENGHPTMPCVVLVILYLMCNATIASIQMVNASRLLTRIRFAQLASKFGRDDAQSMASFSVDGGTLSAESQPKEKWFRWIITVFKVSLGYRAHNTTTSGQDQEPSDLDVMRALSESRGSLALFMIFIVFALPNFVYIAIMFGISPVYQGNCVGCEIFVDLIVVMAFHGGFVTYFILRVHHIAAAKTHDGDTGGELRQLFWSYMLCPPWQAVGYLLLVIDPMDINYRNIFAPEWFILVGVLGFWVMGTPLQLYFAFMEWYNKQPDSVSFIGAEQGLSNTIVRDAYEAWAEQNYVVESYRFMLDASSWRMLFYDRAEKWRRNRAKTIYDMYMVNGGIMEINISFKTVEEIRNVLNQQDGEVIKYNLFDAALSENYEVIEHGLWKRFCQFVVREQKESILQLLRHNNNNSAVSTANSVGGNSVVGIFVVPSSSSGV